MLDLRFVRENPEIVKRQISENVYQENSGSTDGTGSDKAGREKIYAAFPQIGRK